MRAVFYLAVLAVNLAQHPGTTTFDTKLDLLLNPGSFLHRSLSMWNPNSTMGEIQNQAYGFLFPMGPYFWLGDALGVPMWIWQRLWSGLLILVAVEGARRILRVLGALPVIALVGGLAYGFAPRVITTVGVLTGETLPGVILPWTVLPLLLGLVGRLSMRWALTWSAASVILMGGQNATEVLATLPLPFLILALSSQSLVRKAAHLSAWTGMVVLACAWWLAPLLLMARYSPDFLDYIESAANVTAPVGWFASLRGATHWVAYLPAALSHWQAGHDLTYQPFLVLLTATLGGIGLLGLVQRKDLPHRSAWVVSALGAMALMSLGHGGATGSPFAQPFRDFLDGPGAAFRNIHKFDPVARLPLAVGVAFACGAALGVVQRWAPYTRLMAGKPRLVRRLPGAVALALVSGLALPAAMGSLRAPDGWREIPQSWRDAAVYLRTLPAQSRSLVLPGSGFAAQTWGRTVDEVLQADGNIRFATRSQVPLAPSGSIRMLESLEQMVASGRPSSALAPALARNGFSHLVVRNDLEPTQTDAPSPARVHATVTTSPGLTRTAAFGIGRDGFPMVEIFAVDTPVALVSAVPSSDVATLDGSIDGIVPALESGALDPSRPTISSGDPAPAGTERADLVTESEQRRERNFGRVHEAASHVMTAAEPYVLDRRAHDYRSRTERTPHTLADYGDIAAVETSSGASRPDSLGAVQAERGPWAALDRSLETSWASAPFTAAVGQWFEVRLKEPKAIPAISLVFDVRGYAHVRAVTVETDVGSEQIPVDSSGRATARGLPPGETTRLRLTVDSVEPQYDGQVAIADLELSGIDDTRSLVVPGVAGPDSTIAFSTAPALRSCLASPVGLACSPDQYGAEETTGIDRTFGVDGSGKWTISGYASADKGATPASLFEPLGGKVKVLASSTFNGDPQVNPSRALDGDPLTGWMSGEGDVNPRLELSWEGKRTITRVQVSNTRGLPGSRPKSVVVEGGKKRQIVPLGAEGLGVIQPVTTDRLQLTFLSSATSPVGVSELVVDGLKDLAYRAGPELATSLPCGFGPPVILDGTKVETRVEGTLGDVLDGARMLVEPCGGPVTLRSGTHRVAMEAGQGFQPTNLVLSPSGANLAMPRSVATTVEQWSADSRTVLLAADDQTLLTVAENANSGWRATLAGKDLVPVTVDGWKQGWLVPAGGERRVTLAFEPAGAFRWAIVLGGALAFLLAAVAAIGMMRERARLSSPPEPIPAAPAARRGWIRTGALLVVALAISGLGAGIPAAVGVLAAAILVARYCAPVLAAVLVLPAAAALIAVFGSGSSFLWLSDGLAAAAAGLVLGAFVMGGVSREC